MDRDQGYLSQPIVGGMPGMAVDPRTLPPPVLTVRLKGLVFKRAVLAAGVALPWAAVAAALWL